MTIELGPAHYDQIFEQNKSDGPAVHASNGKGVISEIGVFQATFFAAGTISSV